MTRTYTTWRKSTRSDDGNCVEIAHAGDGFVGVRDSKDPDGPVVEFDPATWTGFTGAVRTGAFEH